MWMIQRPAQEFRKVSFQTLKENAGNMISKADFEHRRKIQRIEWDGREQSPHWWNSGEKIRREKSKNDSNTKTSSEARKSEASLDRYSMEETPQKEPSVTAIWFPNKEF